MKFSIFIINLALTGALDVLDAVNKENGTMSVQHRTLIYVITESRANWITAFNSCITQGGYLATPSTPELDQNLQVFLTNVNFAVNDVVWLGGRMALSGGGWDWVLESPNEDIRYTNFLVRCEDHLPGWGLYMTRTEDGLYVCEFGERQTPSTTTITTIETTLTTVAVTATSTTVGQSETTSITTPTTGRTSVSTPTAITTLVTETTSPSGAEISSKSGSVYGFAILIWVIMTYNNFF
ncbi:C-type lectin domain family 4 member F [Folsomia candida]|uniref:C-type lectin domain family 4 member F n=1 Tax=Folsomia candida TaxID=158441 RepID=A0A226DPZ2_FOLCA|nr:C-type lectin domain family 4 member F [Folsomia candida]